MQAPTKDSGTGAGSGQKKILKYTSTDYKKLKDGMVRQLDTVSKSNKLFRNLVDDVFGEVVAHSVPYYSKTREQKSSDPPKRRYVIASTCSGKTRLALIAPVLSFLMNKDAERLSAGPRHITVISVPYKVIAFQYFGKLSRLRYIG